MKLFSKKSLIIITISLGVLVVASVLSAVTITEEIIYQVGNGFRSKNTPEKNTTAVFWNTSNNYNPATVASTITQIGTCIVNSTNVDYFVPTRTKGEWNSFVNATYNKSVTGLSFSNFCPSNGQCSTVVGENCANDPEDCGACSPPPSPQGSCRCQGQSLPGGQSYCAPHCEGLSKSVCTNQANQGVCAWFEPVSPGGGEFPIIPPGGGSGCVAIIPGSNCSGIENSEECGSRSGCYWMPTGSSPTGPGGIINPGVTYYHTCEGNAGCSGLSYEQCEATNGCSSVFSSSPGSGETKTCWGPAGCPGLNFIQCSTTNGCTWGIPPSNP